MSCVTNRSILPPDILLHSPFSSLIAALLGRNECGRIVWLDCWVGIDSLSLFGGDALVFLCVFEFGGFRARSRRMSLQVFNRMSRVLQKIALAKNESTYLVTGDCSLLGAIGIPNNVVAIDLDRTSQRKHRLLRSRDGPHPTK